MAPVGLSPEELQSFKDTYKKAFGEDIDDAEASDLAYRLEELYGIILMKPDAPAAETRTGLSEAPP